MIKDLPQFLQNKAVQKLFDVLDANDEQLLRIVGGAVRNYLLNKDASDVDFATVRTPDQVIRLSKEAGLKVIPTGIDHGTVTVVVDGNGFEVTTLRKDVETDGRHAVVVFSQSWEDDARRRDFTMNALYMDRYGSIFDPLGQGHEDLNNNVVRFIGDAEQRIKEDALRILRFLRFTIFYGDTVNEEGLSACQKQGDLLRHLSRERITEEMMRICTYAQDVDKFVNNISHIFDIDWFNEDIVSVHNLNVLAYVFERQKTYLLKNKLTILYCMMRMDADHIKKELVLSRKETQFLKDLESALSVPKMPVKELLYRFGQNVGQQALLFREDEAADITFAKAYDVPLFPITGQDLLDNGLQAGPTIGVIMNDIEAWWIQNDFKPSRENCLSYLITLKER